MPYDLYWYGDLNAFYIYQEKYKLEQKRKRIEDDYNSWLNNVYNKRALMSVYKLFNGMIDTKKAQDYEYPKEAFVIEEEKKKTPEYKKQQEKIRKMNADIEKYNRELQQQLKDKQKAEGSE